LWITTQANRRIITQSAWSYSQWTHCTSTWAVIITNVASGRTISRIYVNDTIFICNSHKITIIWNPYWVYMHISWPEFFLKRWGVSSGSINYCEPSIFTTCSHKSSIASKRDCPYFISICIKVGIYIIIINIKLIYFVITCTSSIQISILVWSKINI
jgi:hypothetical protein